MGTKVNLYKQSGTDDGTSVNFNLPRSLTYGLNARANDDGGVTESDNCEYNTLNGLSTLLKSSSLIITPNSYKEGKLYSVIPSDGSGDMSVVRATTATRVNSAGLVELVPYNLAQYSEDFSNAVWFNSEVSLLSGQSSPNGTNTAFKITASSASNAYIAQTSIPVTSGNTYTVSVYLKGDTSGSVSLRVDSGSVAPNNPVSYTTEWQRFTYTFTAGSTTATAVIGGYSSWTGNETIYVYGFQLVEGSTAKDYQKTETRLNIPRLDYSNGSCPSLLVEPQRTNLCTYSEDFTNGWSEIGSTVTATANYGVSPSGTNTSTRIQFSSSNLIWSKNISGIVGNNSTFSLYIKGVVGETILITIGNNNETLTLLSGWNRYDVTGVAATPLIFLNTYGGATARDIEVWGGQVELGSYPTSYIPTTSASVTRNEDVISKTGISSLIGQTEGTFFVDFYATNGVAPILINLATSNQIFSEGIYLEYGPSSGSLSLRVYTNGVLVGGVTKTGINLGTRYKVSVAYKANDTAMYIDGVLVAGAIQPNAIQSSLSQLYIGNLAGLTGNATFTGAIVNAAALWKTRLTNTQLAELTTL